MGVLIYFYRIDCLVRLQITLALAISFSAITVTQAANSPGDQFVEDLKILYLSDKEKQNARIGIELELNGLSIEATAKLVQSQVGGQITGNKYDQVLTIKDTVIGDVKIERESNRWAYEDYIDDERGGKEHRAKFVWSSVFDALTSSVEIVYPIIEYHQLKHLENISAALKKAGAVGAKGLSAAAIQSNLSVDAMDSEHLRRIKQNYTNNQALWTDYYQPSWIRTMRSFLRTTKAKYAKELKNYDYQPSAAEFWIDHSKGDHIKFSTMSVGQALLEQAVLDEYAHDAETRKEWIAEGWGHRSAVEGREANACLEPGAVTKLVDGQIALVAASRTTGHINAADMRTQISAWGSGNIIQKAEATNLEGKLAHERPFDHSLSKVLDRSSFVKVRMAPAKGAQTSFVDQEKLTELGLSDAGLDLSQVKEAFGNRFAFEFVRPDAKEMPKDVMGEHVIALAYNDGYLGRGDGRASWLFEITKPGVGTFDFGSKGNGITEYVIPQESIDAGFHIAEKDGLLSLSEAISTLANTWLLEAVGIESEKIVGIMEIDKTTGHNLDPPKPEPAAIAIRFFENGLRGAHLRQYSPEEMKRVALWLRQREAVRLNRGEEIPPLEVYLKNKIHRDARRAALAQHFWVVHGAINVANIFEGGWADLAYVEALAVPDGQYSPLNVYSRLEYQSKEFFKVTNQFVTTLQQAEPGLEIDASTEYWNTYQKELARLELISAGFTPEDADLLCEKNWKMAKRYSDLVWKINYSRLRTDTRHLKARIAQDLSRGPYNPRATEKRARRDDVIESSGFETDRVWSEEMFFKDRWAYRIADAFRTGFGFIKDSRMSFITIEETNSLARLTEDLAHAVVKQRMYKGEVFNVKSILEKMMESSWIAANIRLPGATEIHGLNQKYLQTGSGDINSFLSGFKAKVDRNKERVAKVYGQTEQQFRSAIGKARTSNNVKEVEKQKIKNIQKSRGGCSGIFAGK